MLFHLHLQAYLHPPTIDLSNSGLEEFQQPEFEGYGPKASKSVCKDTSNEVKKTPDAPLGEKLVSEKEKQTIFPTKIESVKQQEKPTRKPVNFNHVQAHCNYHQREGMVNGNNYTRVNYNYSAKKAHPNSHRNIPPRAVLMKTGLKPLNTTRPVNTAHPKTIVYRARPMSCFSKLAQSAVKRPYQSRTTLTNKNFNQKYNTAKEKVYTAKPKAVNTAKQKAVNIARPTSAVVNAVRANQVNAVKASACWVWRPTKLNSASITFKRQNYIDARGRSKVIHKKKTKDMLIVDARCSRHMTGNMSYLSDFKKFDRGYVTFRGGARGGRITGKGTLKLMCDKHNSVLFTDTACFVLSPNFKLPDESQVLLKFPRKNNMYSVDMKNIVLKESLMIVPDSHRKATPKPYGKQHKASCKSKIQNSITQPLFMLHMDLFGLTFVSSLMNKKYCLVVTDDYSRFTWVFFLATKDETSGILKSFITEVENLVDKKVKIIICDNGTEFKNRVMSEFCEKKGIKKEFSVARTPQQNGVAERRNRTLIEAARTIDDGKKDDEGYGVLIRRMKKTTNEQGFISVVYEGKTHEDLHTCLLACFLSQVEPKK
ncbi:putative ribonuclease H-like domain-containing protein, partial [Tanacetum coccineum]